MNNLTEQEFKERVMKSLKEIGGVTDEKTLEKIVSVIYDFQNGKDIDEIKEEIASEIKRDYEPHTKEWYENYAKEHGYKLTKVADKVIESVNKCFAYCPCRYNMYLKEGRLQNEFDKILCPCVYIEEDMEHCKGKTKTCHCHLFEKCDDENKA